MHRSQLTLLSLIAVLSSAQLALAEKPKAVDRSNQPVTLAVIGDSPYGTPQVADFPALVSAINADPDVARVVHVGDIKNGSTRCDTSYFATIAGYFTTFADPLVYSPGDNETAGPEPDPDHGARRDHLGMAQATCRPAWARALLLGAQVPLGLTRRWRCQQSRETRVHDARAWRWMAPGETAWRSPTLRRAVERVDP